MLLKNQRSLDSLHKFKDPIIEVKDESLKVSKSVVKLPKISKPMNINNTISHERNIS